MTQILKTEKSPNRHFGHLHTPLHAYLELPPEQRSAVVWNTQIASLTKQLEKARETISAGVTHAKNKRVLSDPFYNHAWLTAYDALENHPYQKKVETLFEKWWSLDTYFAADVVNQGIVKRLTQGTSLLEVAFRAMSDTSQEMLFLKMTKRQKFLAPSNFIEVIKTVLPVAKLRQWSCDFTTNDTLNDASKPFDTKLFIEAIAAKLTAFGRFNTNYLTLPDYNPEKDLNNYIELAEIQILSEASRLQKYTQHKHSDIEDELISKACELTL